LGYGKSLAYDLAVSDGRNIDKDGRAKTPVRNSVNVKTGKLHQCHRGPATAGFLA
jgi:hypothetical protein